MGNPIAERGLINLIALAAFIFALLWASSDKSFVVFLFAIAIGYFCYRRLYSNKKNARKRMEQNVKESITFIREVYKSSDSGHVHLGISDHYLVMDDKGKQVVWNLSDVVDYDIGEKGTGVYQTQVSDIGPMRTSRTTESKISYIRLLLNIRGAEIEIGYFSDRYTINRIIDHLNKAFTSGVIAQEKEQQRRAEMKQKSVENTFEAFLHEAVNLSTPEFINSLNVEKDSLISGGEAAIANFKQTYPQLNALNSDEVGLLHELFSNAYLFGSAIRTLAGQHGVSTEVVITDVDTEPVIYKVIGQNRSLIGNLPYFTDQQAYEFVRLGINSGFEQAYQFTHIN